MKQVAIRRGKPEPIEGQDRGNALPQPLADLVELAARRLARRIKLELAVPDPRITGEEK